MNRYFIRLTLLFIAGQLVVWVGHYAHAMLPFNHWATEPVWITMCSTLFVLMGISIYNVSKLCGFAGDWPDER